MVKRNFKLDLSDDREYLQTLSLDDLLEIVGCEQPSPTLRREIQEREEGIEHPQFGTICYEYPGEWTGHRVVDSYNIEIHVCGRIDGPDPVLADDLVFALDNFASLWADALSLILEEGHQFGIKNPDGFTPNGITCKRRKGKKSAYTMCMSLTGDDRRWWMEFKNHQADSFGYYTFGRIKE